MRRSAVTSVQGRVQDTIDRLVESGAERGVQVAVYFRGEQVADAVAGIADPATGQPVTPATVFNNYSIGKGITSAVVHVLAERGVFSYDTPVAELWPDFAAHGKGGVTIRHVLTHSAGVPGLPAGTTAADICDWDAICAVIADAEPWWEPGTRVGYHAYTFGFIAGEVVRRATGMPISRVLREDVAGPLGAADELYFGMPESEHGRLARLEDGESIANLASATTGDHPDGPRLAAGPPALQPTARLGNRPDILAADIPATGEVTARAIARMYAAMLGEVDGCRLIPPQRLHEVAAIAARGTDEILGNPSVWGLGYAIGLLGSTPEQSPAVFGMGGAGGSYAGADTASGVAFAVTKNRLTMDFGTATEVAAIVRGAFS